MTRGPAGQVSHWEFGTNGRLTVFSGPGSPPFGYPSVLYTVAGDKLTYDSNVRRDGISTKVTTTYTILKLTDDELEVRSANGIVMTYKKVKPKEPDPKPKEPEPKYTPKMLTGKWERLYSPPKEGSPIYWEFTADEKWTTHIGSGKPSPGRLYTLAGDRLTFDLIGPDGKALTYTITKLTDDELELKSDRGMRSTYQKVKPKEPDPKPKEPEPKYTPKMLTGKWEQQSPVAKGKGTSWEFTDDGKLSITTEISATPRPPSAYALEGDKLSYDLTIKNKDGAPGKVTMTYTITKLTEDELEMKRENGPPVTYRYKKVKPKEK